MEAEDRLRLKTAGLAAMYRLDGLHYQYELGLLTGDYYELQATDYMYRMGAIDHALWESEISRAAIHLGLPGVRPWLRLRAGVLRFLGKHQEHLERRGSTVGQGLFVGRRAESEKLIVGHGRVSVYECGLGVRTRGVLG